MRLYAITRRVKPPHTQLAIKTDYTTRTRTLDTYLVHTDRYGIQTRGGANRIRRWPPICGALRNGRCYRWLFLAAADRAPRLLFHAHYTRALARHRDISGAIRIVDPSADHRRRHDVIIHRGSNEARFSTRSPYCSLPAPRCRIVVVVVVVAAAAAVGETVPISRSRPLRTSRDKRNQ